MFYRRVLAVLSTGDSSTRHFLLGAMYSITSQYLKEQHGLRCRCVEKGTAATT